jgi:transposase
MALTTRQKDSIHRRANKGESGSALAAEFGVSPSMISNIKNHYTPNSGATTTSTKSSSKKTTASVSVRKAATTKTTKTTQRSVFIHSAKFTGKEFKTSAVTFGDLLSEVGENEAVEAVIKGAKNREKLQNSTDRLPDTNGEPLHLYLVPLKTDAGQF